MTASFREISLRIPNDLTFLPAILALVRELSSACGLDKQETLKVEMSLEEVITNEIRHSFAKEEEASFELVLQPLPAGVEIRVLDAGRPFDPRETEQYHPEELLLQKDPKGLGSYLVRHLMDSVEYKSLGNKGKMLRMVKYRENLDPRFDTEQQRGYSVTPEPEVPPLPQSFVVRRFAPEDAYDLAELAYDTYGYSYLYEAIYYPDRTIAQNGTNELVSCVAVSGANDLAGHVALVCEPALPGIAEKAMAMVKPAYRGYNLLGQISDLCNKEARGLGLNGMFVLATTAHVYSQKVAKKEGFLPTGFLLGYLPAMDLKKIEGIGNDRITPVLMFRLLRDYHAGRVFLPEQHKAIITTLLDRVNVGWEAGTEGVEEREHSTYTIKIYPVASIARMFVYETGRDIISELKRFLVRLRQERIQVGELLLNLGEPCTASLYVGVEALGFIFTGILPSSTRGTFITLIYLNGINANFDNIILAEDNGLHLLDYIRNGYEKQFVPVPPENSEPEKNKSL